MSMLPTYETCYDCSSLILLASMLSINKKKWKEEITLSCYWPLYAQCMLWNSADSGSMIHIVPIIDSWCMLHMSSICDTCYRMMMLVQRDRDQYECSSIWYLWHDSSMLSIITTFYICGLSMFWTYYMTVMFIFLLYIKDLRECYCECQNQCSRHDQLSLEAKWTSKHHHHHHHAFRLHR